MTDDPTIFRDKDIGSVFPWAEVSRVHRSRLGIYQKNGRLISLLTDFGKINPCYPDFHGASQDIIHYTGSGRRGDQKLDPANRAMMNAETTAHDVPLFNKLGVNQWQYLGRWTVEDHAYVLDGTRRRMVWKFVIRRQPRSA